MSIPIKPRPVQPIADLLPEQIAEMLDKYAVIEQIMVAVKERAIRLAHNGVTIPGWEPCDTPARRGWKDPDKAIAVLEKLGLEKRERYSIELLSPAQAEKALRKKGLWPKKPRGGAEPRDPFAKVLSYTETKPTIRKVL